VRVTDLPDPWRGSPYLLGEHAGSDVVAAWPAADALVAVVDGPGRGAGLIGLGDPSGVARVCVEAAADVEAAASAARFASLERGAFESMPADLPGRLGFPGEGSSWDWMWTARRLSGDPSPAERLPLGPATTAEVAECLSRGHPTASTEPDDDRVVGWWGVRSDGRLMAVVGAVLLAPGLPPHLVSLGVDPVTRGQGLAGVVLSAAVRDCLEVVPAVGPPMVSLGLYAHNDVARRVYSRLGFELRHRFSSRRRAARPVSAGRDVRRAGR
jgi:GNAT superfamily N-acetyltransferase